MIDCQCLIVLISPQIYTINMSANVTNNTANTRQWDNEYEKTKIWVRAVTAFVVLLGNSICIVVFLGSKVLRKRPHYLLVHLCLADFLVGVGVLLRLIVDVYYWLYGTAGIVLRSFTFTLDYFSNIASIYVLTSISIERFLAIVFPLFHRLNGKSLYVILMGVPWGLSCIISLIYIFSNLVFYIDIDTFELIYLVMITAPVVLIVVAYSVILVNVRKNHVQKNNRTLALRDRKLAVTLLIVTLASVLTWGPYNVYFILAYYCSNCGIKFSRKVFFAFIVLQYWNSAVNFVVYFCRMPQFRQVVKNCCRQHRVSPNQSRSSSKRGTTNHGHIKHEQSTTRL